MAFKVVSPLSSVVTSLVKVVLSADDSLVEAEISGLNEFRVLRRLSISALPFEMMLLSLSAEVVDNALVALADVEVVVLPVADA